MPRERSVATGYSGRFVRSNFSGDLVVSHRLVEDVGMVNAKSTVVLVILSKRFFADGAFLVVEFSAAP